MTTTSEQRAEGLDRAQNGTSTRNYAAIFAGFEAKGIPTDDIQPRVNVFKYGDWQELGRQVRKGEHGVKVTTWIECKSKENANGERDTYKRSRTATVFHITQTDPKGEPSEHTRGRPQPALHFENAGHEASHYDPTGFYSADGTLLGRQNSAGRCEDAPCCGCCT